MLSWMRKRLGKLVTQKKKESLPSAESCAIDSLVRSCTSSPLPAAAAIFIARRARPIHQCTVLSCHCTHMSHDTALWCHA